MTRLTGPAADVAACSTGSALGKSSRGSASAAPDVLASSVVALQGFTVIPHGSGLPARKSRASGSLSTYCHTAQAASERPCGISTSASDAAASAWYFHSGSLMSRKSGSYVSVRGLKTRSRIALPSLSFFPVSTWWLRWLRSEKVGKEST